MYRGLKLNRNQNEPPPTQQYFVIPKDYIWDTLIATKNMPQEESKSESLFCRLWARIALSFPPHYSWAVFLILIATSIHRCSSPR
jgi:lipopolysaccharide export LptBFGC system permease protein LptF